MINEWDLRDAYQDLEDLKDDCAEEIYDFFIANKIEVEDVYFCGRELYIKTHKKIPLLSLSEVENRGFSFCKCRTYADNCTNHPLIYEYSFKW